ncbi:MULTISPECIES: GyrI-like domain-containing protein [Pseudomonas]|jgi:AraC family transcriptional regulator|uniref:AraC family transcriptional regulator n=1 Tax=Pseudomonas bijieensis TaxID=2681983 RepID=A0A6N1CBU8_9PSED|nr:MULTISPECIES: GyrI-like domain-containing protein [Pseudomonas]AXP01812.1 AraC family transcriptional regulator [Pseudomonas fluorescens]MCD9116410.1 GyrI-like domain-containing protein [Pseudomonas bijieensis]PWJ31109.1 AraC family transcriptional regulator [Pseudomonas sp. 43mfcvi1.1]QIB04631.1 AraC family transcriptional regulator [Pseudomonas fluorescens]QKS82568.1 AraC family transcriptional regulator [Pseudomonas bijieensis]
MEKHKRDYTAEPRFEQGRFQLIAGFGARFTQDTAQDIPLLWEKFLPWLGKVPGQKDEVTYGVCCNPDEEGGFEYIAGVEISRLDDLPEQYHWIEIPPGRYAVFEHRGPLKTLPQTFQYIWSEWLPQSGHEGACTPEFERYSEDFNPRTGQGTLEIWIPLKPS